MAITVILNIYQTVKSGITTDCATALTLVFNKIPSINVQIKKAWGPARVLLDIPLTARGVSCVAKLKLTATTYLYPQTILA
ncbi:hypothetical protein COT03_02165 [Candidatus Shapirobacteria bacterium CG07_land_8_20_14_0_80_39_18]|uniref:Uncharacterized protein n=1 Tax=Candidatus Shapirobacteria bacterium CG07_land_8_20_14_0_80_39_18 TaxID=1974882 RepID=A0A2M6YR20_9BACT|nr:MAG: hypothetical protein COT03_02165 [Candidatus Shapirobacteria bacterium CG07_land_8_20_14_0_80_39_18]